MIERYLDFDPVIHPDAWVHAMAYIGGEVRVDARATVWPTGVLRGDQGGIIIGEDSNVQDGTVIHATGGRSTTTVGKRVTIGHRAVIHGCTIEDDVLIGMGAVVMDNAIIRSGSIVGAGAVVLVGREFPPNSMILGNPAHAVRETTPAHREWIEHSWKTYVRLGREHRTGRREES
ncbi:MAG: gamma carbonic anhydrase family protein [Proteobacteria bacterium]|nr:gamma carbonic anhydrase family protein [Pseudomonadota bacterium]